MPISAVTDLKIENRYSVPFGSKRKSQDEKHSQSHSSSTGMKRVPVIVLMAMSPSLLNSAATQADSFAPSVPMELVSEPGNNNLEIYSASLQVQNPQSKPKIDLKQVFVYNYPDIKYYKEFKMNGKTHALVYATPKSFAYDEKRIGSVYIIPEDFKIKSNSSTLVKDEPPSVTKVIFHFRNEETEDGAIGVVISEDKYDSRGNHIGYSLREILLPDEVGEDVYWLAANNTKWKKPGYLSLEEKHSMELEPYIYISDK